MEPNSSIGAFLISKTNALSFSLGGALLALSFRDDAKRSYLIGALNIIASWFIGYTLGDALVERLVLDPAMSNLAYVVSASMGLLIVGGLHRIASRFFMDPIGLLKQVWEIVRRR